MSSSSSSSVSSAKATSCKFYNTSRGCFNGYACGFLHVGPLSSYSPPSVTSAKATSCKFYNTRRGCSNGSACWYLHDRSSCEHYDVELREDGSSYCKSCEIRDKEDSEQKSEQKTVLCKQCGKKLEQIDGDICIECIEWEEFEAKNITCTQCNGPREDGNFLCIDCILEEEAEAAIDAAGAAASKAIFATEDAVYAASIAASASSSSMHTSFPHRWHK